MPKGTLSIAVMIVGLLLLMSSFFYNSGKHTESAWSEEQAKAHAELGAQVHAKSFERDPSKSTGNDPPPDTPELAALREKWEASKAQLDSARDGRKRNGRILLILGIVVTASGVAANRFGY
jgi:hypothetical protein